MARQQTACSGTLQVWIGCLAAYNEGCLHGEWIDATDVDTMTAGRDRVIASSPALLPEEWFIADYDNFGSLASTLGEYAQFETVARIGALIEEHGEPFLAFAQTCDDLDALDGNEFQSCYQGEYPSEEAFAEGWVLEVGWGGVPSQTVEYGSYPKVQLNPIEELLPYLDMESIARDLFMDDFTSAPSPGGVYVFRRDA